MKQGSFSDDKLSFFLAATIAAHATSQNFRQRDVKFYIELFLDWTNSPFEDHSYEIHNAQVLRFLNSLEREGFLRKIKKGKFPGYRLSRTGLVESIRGLHEKVDYQKIAEFYFIVYFLNSYKKKIISLIESEGKQFPPSLKIEIESLLNVREIISRHIKDIEKYILTLRERILDNQQATILANNMLRAGKNFEEIVEAVQEAHPYQLNNQKSLRKLISEIPEELQLAELTQGGEIRGKIIWEPLLELYNFYLKQLKCL